MEATLARADDLLSSPDPSGAWVELDKLADTRLTDRRVARLWARGLRWPDDPMRLKTAASLIRELADDLAVVRDTTAALVAHTDSIPRDEPDGDPTALLAAAAACRRLASALDDDPETTARLLHLRANALRLCPRDHDTEATEAFAAALAVAPDDSAIHYDLGLHHKWRGRFEESLHVTAVARRLGDQSRAAAFNTAIAATALGQGQVAADAYADVGIAARVNDAGMPRVDGVPKARVRVPCKASPFGGSLLGPQGAGFEMVWVQPLSPCHGVVVSPSYHESPVDYGDVVLWDVAPIHVATVEGAAVPTFALLEILNRGSERRLRFVALQQEQGAVERWADGLPEGGELFVQRERVESVCRRCASGLSLQPHEHTAPEEHRVVHGKLIVHSHASLRAIADKVDDAKTNGAIQLAVPALYEALEDTVRAGKEHRLFMSIDRIGKA